MNACRPFHEQLSARIDGELPPAEETRLQEHLGQCPACRQAQADLARTVARIRSLEPVEPPAWLAERILARVAAPAPPGGWLLALIRRPAFQIAAGLLVCLTGYLTLRVAPPTDRGLPPQPSAPPALATPAASSQPEPAPMLKSRPHAQEERAQPATPSAPSDQPAAQSTKQAAPSAQPAAPSPTFAPAPSAEAGAPSGGRPALEGLQLQETARKAAKDEAAPRLRAHSTAPPTLSYRLTAREPLVAPARVQALLREAGATLLTVPAPDRPQLTARLPAEALPTLLARLETLGRLEGPRPDPAGTGERILIIFW
jgi:hypothetical protein